MSSLRNAVQRRNHKERAQPLERQRFGLLEKRKDYLLRARDYKSKQARLKLLAEKANTRNPDEFNHNMINRRTHGGIPVGDRFNQSLSIEAVKLLKTQDVGYLRLKNGAERKAIEKLEEETAFANGKALMRGDSEEEEETIVETSSRGKRKHIVFVDSKEEAVKFDPAAHFGTHPELLNRTYNRPKIEQLSTIDLPETSGTLSKEKAAKFRELATRMKRAEELRKVELELELQRQRMGKGRMVGKNKWAQERKR